MEAETLLKSSPFAPSWAHRAHGMQLKGPEWPTGSAIHAVTAAAPCQVTHMSALMHAALWLPHHPLRV